MPIVVGLSHPNGGYMPKKKSAAAVARGKKLQATQKRKARALYNANKAKFDKMAKAWCKVKRTNKKKKSKRTGKMVTYNIFFQFRDAVIKAGGSTGVAQILWKAHCGKFHPKKKAPAKKSSTKKGQMRKTSRRAYEPKKKTSSKKKSSSSKKKAIKSGPAFNAAGKRLKKLKPKIKISGKSYDTLAKRKAAIAKAKAKK